MGQLGVKFTKPHCSDERRGKPLVSGLISVIIYDSPGLKREILSWDTILEINGFNVQIWI